MSQTESEAWGEGRDEPRGNVSLEKTPATGARNAAERTYDPFWTNALTLLDFLEDNQLIQRDLRAARIGQVVLVTGTLLVLDIKMLQAAWNAPEIKRVVFAGVQQSLAPALGAKGRNQEAKQQTDFLFALIKLMPHFLQARLIGDNGGAWCALDETAMVGRASDLMLKDGTMINGEWAMLGVLDALPYNPNPTTEDGRPFSDVLASIAGRPMGGLSAQLAPLAQQMLGQPPQAHGVTPILIFRKVSA